MIELVGFDADDTLWHSERYYRAAQDEYESILAGYLDLADARVHERLLDTERRNVRLFGYGAKGMTLSMLETAVAVTDERIAAADIHRILEIGKSVLQHPVELLDGVREAVADVARSHAVVLITKGDLFHQERKVAESGLADLFGRIEIVSEKDQAAYARLFSEFKVGPGRFAMVGNSLRSDIEPVVRLGGWGVHVPCDLVWALDAEHGLEDGHARVETVATASEVPAALERLSAKAGEADAAWARGLAPPAATG